MNGSTWPVDLSLQSGVVGLHVSPSTTPSPTTLGVPLASEQAAEPRTRRPGIIPSALVAAVAAFGLGDVAENLVDVASASGPRWTPTA